MAQQQGTVRVGVTQPDGTIVYVEVPNTGPDSIRTSALAAAGSRQPQTGIPTPGGLAGGGGAAAEPPGLLSRIAGATGRGVLDLGVGFGQGVGNLEMDVLRLLRKAPGGEAVTDAVLRNLPGAPEGLNAPQAFAEFEGIPAENAMQSLGQGAEFLTEFMVPVTKAAKLARGVTGAQRSVIKGGIRASNAVDNALLNITRPSQAMNALFSQSAALFNQLAPVAARFLARVAPSGAAGATAGAISALHRDPNPQIAAAFAAAGPLAGFAGTAFHRGLIRLGQTEIGATVVPLLLAGGAISLVPQISVTGGMGMTMGLWGASRGIAHSAINNPQLTQQIQQLLAKWLPQVMNLGAATASGVQAPEREPSAPELTPPPPGRGPGPRTADFQGGAGGGPGPRGR